MSGLPYGVRAAARAPADDHTDRLQAALTDYPITAIDEASNDEWRVFFDDTAARDRALVELRTQFATLRFDAFELPDEDWAARSQSDLRAIHVGRIIVAPPWDEPLTIVIRPSMGFGTGHHATTRLCLAALQHIDLEDRSVLDVGTGSGILAIAASRLGAAEVTAIDEDADAVHAAWDNLALNPAAQVSLIVGDLHATELVPADVLLANLTGALLTQSAARLRQLAKADARLVLSGFLTEEERDVLGAFGAFSVDRRGEEQGWVCVTLK